MKRNDKKRYGIPKTNATREWNGRDNIHEWQCKNELHIKRLIIDANANKYVKASREDGNDVALIINSSEYWTKLKEMNEDLLPITIIKYIAK
jgi:hypothetical protein